MSGHLLELEDVHAGYGGIRVLWGLDLTVDAGAVCCVLGPNGAGKSTMAQVIAGTIPTAAGRIVFDGRDITSLKPETRAGSGIAHVPQGRRVFPELTTRENLEVARFAAGDRASADTEVFVDDLFPKLKELSKMPAGRLSPAGSPGASSRCSQWAGP
jgi:branched-chain amino acid transport system ATP-binding protein